jgi:isoleucyl-tRNA synthetase
VDKDGLKMSKTAGNVRDPWALIDVYGADVLRWLLLVEGNPWQPRRVDDDNLNEITRKFFMTIWNTYYFFATYANLRGWRPQSGSPSVADRPVMDRYILAELADASKEIDAAFTDFDVPRAGRRLQDFVNDLSNWYVRRSRSRFSSDDLDDSNGAFDTLYTCLKTLTGLLAPLAPFFADELFEELVRAVEPDSPASIHLIDFPAGSDAVPDQGLRETMSVARKLVTLGREARASAGVPLRQPLKRVVLTMPAEVETLPDEVRDVIADELNVKQISRASAEGPGVVSLALKPNFRTLGPIFGQRTPAVAAAIQKADSERAAAALRSGGRFGVDVDGAEVEITSEHVEIEEKPVTGWQVSTNGAYSVALDTTIDRPLRVEGMARQLVRTVNELRKQRGLNLSETIALRLEISDDPDGEIEEMLTTHGKRIARETASWGLDHGDLGSANHDNGERLEFPGGGSLSVECVASSE